jgi:uncharacterized protein (TIGR00290 family)
VSIAFSWSGGKDSAMALNELAKNGQPVAYLLSTVTKDYDRVSMHGVRRSLLERQSESIGIPLEEVFLSKKSSNAEYEERMSEKLSYLKANGVTTIGFGDIFLADLRKWREERTKSIGMDCVFPIWKRDTRELASTFIRLGFKAVIACVDSKALGKEFAGREFDGALLSDLPKGVDPCGENGEFHTFVYDGPIFKDGIEFNRGEVVLRESRFYYCDLIPK